MTCQVCRYHSGPLTVSQECCPIGHHYEPRWLSVEQLREHLAIWEASEHPEADVIVRLLRADLAAWEQEQDDIGQHMNEMEGQ